MTEDQVEDMEKFLENKKMTRGVIYLKYLKAYDFVIQDKMDNDSYCITEEEMASNAILAIYGAFRQANRLIRNKWVDWWNVDLLMLFKGYFIHVIRQNKRDNLPIAPDSRERIFY